MTSNGFNQCCHRVRFSLITCGLFLTWMSFSGCAFDRFADRFRVRQPQVFETDVSKTELVRHLNRNILGTESSPGISSWRTSDATVKVTGIPFELPAAIAVEAPMNLRIVINRPVVGTQEVDLGSNKDGFWIWTKEQTEMITCSHEDTSLALQHFEMPIQIQPEWLMEVFGVVPINEASFTLERSATDEPVVDLVAAGTSPTGQQVERVIRVNTYTGNIDEHLLRKKNGEIIATATLDKYTKMPNGTVLPTFVKIKWHAAKTEMKISLGHPEVNPPSFAVAHRMFDRPDIPNSKVVDIGLLSRQAVGQRQRPQFAESQTKPASTIRQLEHAETQPFPTEKVQEVPGQVALAPTQRLQAPRPINASLLKSQTTTPSPRDSNQSSQSGIPAWAQEHSTQKPIVFPQTKSTGMEAANKQQKKTTSVPVTWQPSTYSPTTWRSSSDRLPPARE